MGSRRILIYGAGKGANKIVSLIKDTGMEIAAIVDSNSALWGTEKYGEIIQKPSCIHDFQEEYWIISIADTKIHSEVRSLLLDEFHMNPEREMSFRQLQFAGVENYYQKHFMNRTGSSVPPDKKDTVIFDCFNGLVLGGIEAWTMDLCENLLREGINARILSDEGKYTVSKSLEDTVDKVIDSRDKWSLENAGNVMEYLGSFECPTVITSKPNIVLMVASIMKKNGSPIKIIAVIHNGTPETYSMYAPYQEWVDCYVGVSMDIGEGMRNLGVDSRKILCVTLPFACEEEIKRSYHVKKEDPVHIGYAGRLVVLQKRIDLLALLVDEMERRKIPYIFEIAGDGDDKYILQEYISEKHLENKVRLIGVLDRQDIPDFWKSQDIAINIADHEGRCISKLEAMANGAVPIVTDVAGTKEDIDDGENGFFVPIGDYCAMAERVEYLADHRELLPVLGQKAHDKVFPKSSMKEHIRFWKELLA